MSEPIEAEIVDENESALVVQESAPVSLFGTTSPEESIDKAAQHATALARVINERNLYSKIQGRDHVQVEGWQLLGSMTGVFAVVTQTSPVVDSSGKAGWEARCEARTMDGRVIGAADAMCTRSENTWSSRDDYAIRSMAQTRATSKALKGPLGFIVKLAGYSSTPLEEIPHDEAEYDGPECPECAGPVWDNSTDPNRGKRPQWKCRDRNCNWASWDDNPFSPGEAEPPSDVSASVAADSPGAPTYSQVVRDIGSYINGEPERREIVRAAIKAKWLSVGASPPDKLENAEDYAALDEGLLKDVLLDLTETASA